MLTERMILIATAIVLCPALAACAGMGDSALRDPTPLASERPSTGQAAPTFAAVATETPPSPGSPLESVCAPPYPGVTATTKCADPAGMQPATVDRIIDGDTFDAILDDGQLERIRIFGIDTPERGDACFREASDTLEALAGDGVLLLADERNRDSSGRLLRYVFRPDGLSIDAAMIELGMATAWTRDGALRDPLVQLEARARLAGAGCLW